MKLEVPDAFSPVIPFVPEVGFIDAQIKLMFMPHENAWDVFMFKQFVLPVQHMFRDGASKVILAFDDYDNVPRAKSITQVCHQTYTLNIKLKLSVLFGGARERPTKPARHEAR